jgi:hypothetical protein
MFAFRVQQRIGRCPVKRLEQAPLVRLAEFDPNLHLERFAAVVPSARPHRVQRRDTELICTSNSVASHP